MKRAGELKYSYHFKWMGRPIIQHPQDMIATQQLIWDIKPDLIVETGIARGGSLIFYASLLELISNSGKNTLVKILSSLKHYLASDWIFMINLIFQGKIFRSLNTYLILGREGNSYRI